MKKILLATSALIGAAAFASAANAEEPKVTVGGFNTFEAGYSDSDFDQNERNRTFRNSTEIHFNIAAKSDAGLNYGAEIDLNADIDGAGTGSAAAGQSNSGLNSHRTYAWLGGDSWGHFEMGSNDGAARTLKVDASNIARATGGVDGDWVYFADVNNVNAAPVAGVIGQGARGTFAGANNTYITAPRLPVEHGPATGFADEQWSNDNKVTYYSPKVSGFQLGVSYAPDLTSRGQTASRVDLVAPGTTSFNDIFEGGLSYEGQYDQFGFAAALTGETGKATAGSATHDLGAWNAGAKVTFMGFSVAGSYGDWNDSLTSSTGVQADGSYWTAGGAYEMGPLGASVTYMNSETNALGNRNRFQDISAGIDYKLAPGLTPFAEYTYYDMDPAGGVLDNKGNVVIVGSQLSF